MKKKAWALLLALALTLSMAACGTAAPKDENAYPFSTVTMIVPYGAGGTADLVGRQLANALGEAMGISFVVVNQAGASGSLGCKAALDAKADGSTVLFTAESLGTQRVMGISSMSYGDFRPVAAVANDPKVIVVSKDSPYATIQDLLAEIQAKPNTVQMAYTGPGGSGHVQALILNQFGYFPALTAYSGGSDCLIATMSGQVAFTNSNYSTVSAYIASGDLKLLAVCANEPMAQYPEVPALSQLLPNSESYLSIPYTPLSLLVSADVPEELRQMLKEGCQKAFQDPEFVSFMDNNHVDKLYEKYTTDEEIQNFYSDWESTVSWLLYDAGAAAYSPEDFQIAKPVQ